MKRPSSKMRQRAKELRRALTVSEQRLWNWLRNRSFSGYKFRRQVPAGGYVLDFYCAELKLVIEVDGAHHARLDVAEYDDDRTTWLNAHGVQVVRIQNVVLAKDARLVQDQIQWAIERCVKELGR